MYSVHKTTYGPVRNVFDAGKSGPVCYVFDAGKSMTGGSGRGSALDRDL